MLTARLPEARVLVAVSGGPDSSALLIALHEAGQDIVAAHYDHALREGSERAALLVAELCQARGIRLITERRSEPMPKGSMQAAARALRYAFLERARVASAADVIATAHTADDLVEGAVLHILRGCGLAGLRGMPDRRGRYVRPWLGVWRSDVVEFLRRRGVEAYDDPANDDPRFARVRVRAHVLPALERGRPGIKRRLHAVARVATAMYEGAADRARAAVSEGPVTAVALTSLPEAVAVEVLKLLYAGAGGRQPGLSRSHVRAMLELAKGGAGGRGVDLPGNLRFRIVGDLVQMIPTQRPAAAHRLVVEGCSGCSAPDAVHLRAGLALHVAYRQPGLRLRPAGGRGTRKLQDVFVDARVPREDRDGWPLVFAGHRLAWVPGVVADESFLSGASETGVHVTVDPFPANSKTKVVRLEPPNRPPGDQI